MFDIFEGTDAAEPVFREAERILGTDPRQFVAVASNKELYANHASQVLCVTKALASAKCLSIAPVTIAGYSVGEMAAWGAAGVWSVEATLQLTVRRAELMDAANSNGVLGFVRGLRHDLVAEVVAEFGCYIAIINPDDLYIIGGTQSSVADCCNEATRCGAIASRPLEIYIPSHTPLLSSAVSPLLEQMRHYNISTPAAGIRLFSVSTMSFVEHPHAELVCLARQVASTINWAASLDAMAGSDVCRFLELGPGDAVATMIRKRFPELECRALEEFSSIAAAREWADVS